MASGYDVNGIDLDSIFAAYTSGTKAPATGYTVGGVDLNQRYLPLSAGSAALPTGYDSGGADLNTFFAAAGSTTVTVGTQPGNISGTAAAGDPSGTVTSGTTSCAGSGGTGSYSYTWHIASGSGVSFTSPNSATTGVTGSVSANSTNSGTMYCTISDGISSVNTNTVSWSLTNSTIPVSVSLQPGNVFGSSAAGWPSGTVTSGTTSCSAANGTGSYSYQWHFASGSGASFTNPNGATTAVTGSINAGSTNSGTMYCTITDSTGGTVNTNTVNWSLQNTTPAAWTFSLVAGVNGSLVGFNGNSTHVGTLNGSYNPVQMPSTFYVLEIMDDGTNTYFVVSGITGGDPGQNSLTSLIINGLTFSGSSASYSFSGSQNFAYWTWYNNSAGLANGSHYNGSISGTISE